MTHTNTEQPEALMRLADNYAEACFDQGLNQRTTDDKPETEREKLENAIRHQHARIEELEEQLSTIGAGGVEPLRKRAAPAHPAEGVPAQAVQPSDALIDAVDAWFADNTGLGGWCDGCSPDNCCGCGPAMPAKVQPEPSMGEQP